MNYRIFPDPASADRLDGSNKADAPLPARRRDCPDDDHPGKRSGKRSGKHPGNPADFRHLEDRFARILGLAGVAAWDADFRNSVVWVSPTLADLLGYAEWQLCELVTGLELVHADDQSQVRQALWASRDNGDVFETECRLRHACGSMRWFRIRGVVDWNARGNIDRFSGTVVDIDARLENEQVIEHLSLYDELTDLPNRGYFQKKLEDSLREKPADHHGIGLLLIDLNDFREINDAQGHSAGDIILRQVASRLVGAIRGYDFVARLGDDEFGVLLRRIRSPLQLPSICEHLLDILSEPCLANGNPVSVTASIGITAFPGEGEDAEDLLVQAELAMYEAKRHRLRRGAFEFYEQRQGNDLRERLRLDASLESSIEKGELSLYYQPEINLQDGGVVAVEALVRWQHPRRGLLGPEYFIPAAEASGRIIQLGEWVIAEACREIARFCAQGRSLRIAINLSPLQFQQGNLPELLEHHIAAAGISPELLEIEITESVLISDLDLVRAQLERIHQAGCGISLDDFGSGYSSLTYLHQFPIDQIKIDRSFISELQNTEQARIITRSIINLGDSLGMRVLAEGVENHTQYSLLGKLGCDAAQGFLLARPMPALELAEWLRRDRQLSACDGEPVRS